MLIIDDRGWGFHRWKLCQADRARYQYRDPWKPHNHRSEFGSHRLFSEFRTLLHLSGWL